MRRYKKKIGYSVAKPKQGFERVLDSIGIILFIVLVTAIIIALT